MRQRVVVTGNNDTMICKYQMFPQFHGSWSCSFHDDSTACCNTLSGVIFLIVKKKEPASSSIMDYKIEIQDTHP